MGNRLYDNEFEQFLKDQAGQHRMYPSDQVWRNIQQEIHGYKKWPALTVVAVFIISSLVVGTVLVKPHRQIAPVVVAENVSIKNIEKPAKNLVTKKEANYAGNSYFEDLTQETIAKASSQSELDKPYQLLATDNLLKDERLNIVLIDRIPGNKLFASSNTKQIKDNRATSLLVNTKDDNRSNVSFAMRYLNAEKVDVTTFHFNYPYSFSKSSGYIETTNTNEQLNSIFNRMSVNSSSSSPLARLSGKASKYDFQFYVTPSLSYRRLVDDANGALSKSYITALPFAANYVVDVNQVIRHTPAAGYEIGASLGYNINSNFALRAGLQFNMRQYNIYAFAHAVEPAAIALSGNSDNVYTTISGFRNYSGSSPLLLKNSYYEISLPIGIDWRPVNKKFAWGIAASVQPTYTFDKEPFVITSNFKNYADGSQLMRNWNINANLETYLGYNTGKYRWQIGPQIRYQVIPTMANSYPIKEYLVDYGLKIGLVRSLR